MKLAHLATVDMSVRVLLLNQLLYLREQGHDVHAICRDGPLVAEVRAAGIPVHTIAFNRRLTPGADSAALAALIRLLRRERFELIHTHTPKASLLGQWAALLARVPWRAHTIHGLYLPRRASWRGRLFFQWLERITMRPAQLVFSQSREDMSTATRHNICDAQRLHYLGNGINLEQFNPAQREIASASVRAELNLPPEQRIVGLVGRMVEEKGYLEYVAAAAQISRERSNVTFLCIGPDEPEKSDALSAATIAAAGDQADLRVLGMRHDLPRWYAALDVLAHPSHREGFPRVPMEAAAIGVARVVSDIRGCREVVEHERDGLRVPVGAAPALAAAITRLLDDPALAARLGAAAAERARTDFDERRVFERVVRGYATLTAGAGL